MADRDKAEMEDEIREKVNNRQNTKIIVRSGNPLEASSVAVVNPNDARSIIVLGSEEHMTDTYVIKTILSLTNGKYRKKEKYNIIAEIKDPKNMEAAELVGNNEAEYILTSDIISRITAQTCRQSGLSVVYSELLQFKGDEIYFQAEPKLEGLTYKEVIFQYEKSAVLGILTKSDDALINPPMATIFNNGDQVIAISEDDDTVTINDNKTFSFDESAIVKNQKQLNGPEKTLILGWNERGARIISEMENYVGPGSSVTILAMTDGIEEDIKSIESANQSIHFIEGDINDKATLTNIKTEDFDHIILLSYKDMDVQESDAKTLICLLHLRNLSEKANKDYCIVSEMLDIRNRELGVVAKADDFIVGDNLISLILSQLSENKALKKVYDILFAADGSEIYLKPVSHYVKIGVPINFYTILESAAQVGETAIGYRLSSQSDDSEKQFGVVLNPEKSKPVIFAENDFIIVVAES
jgi:ion channel POLLUX/CASTOR